MQPPAASHAEIPCPFCGHGAPWLLVSPDRNRRIGSEQFSYHKCRSCGLIFLANVPADLGRYYAGGYQAIPETLSELRELAKDEKYRLDIVTAVKPGGKLLEIGPWIGIFSSAAVDAGFQVSAIEADERCVIVLKEMLGVQAIRSEDPARTLEETSETYDVIALWHAIEHIPRPWDVIRAAGKHLNKNGILLIAAPNPDAFDFKLLGGRWPHLDAPRHVNHLPIRLIERIGAEVGLTVLSATTADRLSDICAGNAWRTFANCLVPVRYLRGVLRIVLGNLLRVTFAAQQRRPGRGSGYTVILQRPT